MFCNITNRGETIYRYFKAKLTKNKPYYTHNLPQKTFLKKTVKKIHKNYCTIKSLML